MRAGNGFDDDFKRQYLQEQLTPGRVLYLYCTLATTQKNKYLVLVALEPSPLFLVINSGIPRFIQADPRLCACQVRLRASDYDFLDHDSYANCAEVLDDISLADIVGQLMEDVSRLKGGLTTATREKIIAAVHTAHTVSPAHKRAIETALA